MGFLRGQRQSQQSSAVLPKYTGLQLQTAISSLPVPLCYGLNKLASNIVYYNNFRAIPEFSAQQKSGKGGILGHGGGGGITIVGWYYIADLQLALCEGPISGIGQVWQGQSTYLFASDSPNPNSFSLPVSNLGLSLFEGASDQAAWPGVAGTPWELNYSSTAYLAATGFYLGESASLGTLNFEIAGFFYGTGANGVDADPALVIADFLTHDGHGVGLASGDLDGLFGATGDSSIQTYCKALGLCFSPLVQQYETGSSILDRWLQAINVAAVKSGAKLKFIPYGDLNISGNGVTWVASVDPVYALSDDDFMFSEGEQPITVSRVDPATLATVRRVEVLNRAGVNAEAALVVHQVSELLAALQSASSSGRSASGFELPSPQGQPQYQATPVEARDQAAIQTSGLRVADTVTLHEICDLNVGATLVQIMLQRGLYIRATFKFRLSALYCLLDPMDVVTIYDPAIGTKSVRITELEEADGGVIEVTAEEFTRGVSTPGPNLTMGAISGNNAGLPAPPVNSTLIYEPPAVAANGKAQVWFGASGGVAGAYDPNWGGAWIWASIDGGVTYLQIAKIVAPLAQGVLTAPLASATGWDTADTLAVNLSESGQPLSTTSEGNARAAASNLSLIGSELLAFESAALTGVNAFNLTNLQRGAFGTTPAAHASGAAFSELDNAVKFDLPANYVGVAMKFKFQSFNIYGGGLQDLSTCVPFDYTPTGNGYQGSSRLVTVDQAIALASGSDAVTTIEIPAGAFLLSASVAIASSVSGPSSIHIDPVKEQTGAAGGASGEFGSVGVTAGATHTYSTPAALWSVASAIRLTAVGGGFSGGSAVVTLQFITVG